jgi:hypothetical protein
MLYSLALNKQFVAAHISHDFNGGRKLAFEQLSFARRFPSIFHSLSAAEISLTNPIEDAEALSNNTSYDLWLRECSSLEWH